MARFVKHEPCPKCGSKDNLARYDDGSCFCFGCRFNSRASVWDREPCHQAYEGEETITLPDDAVSSIPEHIVKLYVPIGISLPEISRLGVVWSPSREQLIYPYYATREDGSKYLACYQARNYHKSAKTKYTNKGKTTEVLPIIPSGTGSRRLLITEDALSALKIARQCDAMPALGTNVPVAKLKRIAGLYERLTVWLDSDKLREAREIALNFKWLGKAADTIYSDLDPKHYSDDEIKEFLK